jgi:hypothetical protein
VLGASVHCAELFSLLVTLCLMKSSRKQLKQQQRYVHVVLLAAASFTAFICVGLCLH